ncbi:MAG: protein-L-isoaspartate(D-aspartate) O-methyltransferase [Alphaproteobacteria bacterium]|jgi:protein-L-isoaspartate(D-aspartate) O-methyltransferase
MDFSQARKNMVDGQLTPNKITNNALIKSFLNIPREAFVDVANKHAAYVDSPTRVSSSREMFSPLVCAHLLQSLDLTETDNVLVVASSSGYTASILCGLVNNVYGVEDDLSLLEMARRALLDASCKGVTLCEGAPSKGLEEKAKFDKIMIDVPVEFIPDSLLNQLVEGGKVAAVVKNKFDIYTLKVFTKLNNVLTSKSIREVVSMPVHKGFKKKEEFSL